MTSILELLKNIAGAISNFFGFQKAKLEVNNTPAMQQAKQAQVEQSVQDKVVNEVANEDLNSTRNDLSE